jgi:hypothetical protein
MLRVALSRLLIEFQNDLRALEERGLHPQECDDVKAFLAQAIAAFEQQASGPNSPYGQIAKHFGKFATIYEAWNGHEGDDPGKPELRRKEISLLSNKRRKLFRKLSFRQAEIAATPQLDLPFANSVHLPLTSLAEKHPERFPRLRQAAVLFG